MKKNTILLAGVAGLFIAAALLAGCYAPLANQNGYFNLNLEGARFLLGGTSEVIVLVVNADYKDSLRETLWLIDKGKNIGLSGSEAGRLTTLAEQMATSGLVKFGGFPFYQTTMSGSSGHFEIPGIPAGRDYFVKLYVFKTGFSFKVEDIDANFGNLIQLENVIFPTEQYGTAWQSWGPGQSVGVKAGQSVAINVTLALKP